VSALKIISSGHLTSAPFLVLFLGVGIIEQTKDVNCAKNEAQGNGDDVVRQCFYYSEYSAFICHECKKKPLKRFFYTVIKFISK